MLRKFTGEDLKKMWQPKEDSHGEENGQLTIIGGSELFTGAPILSLVAASRLVDMVFLATPEEDKNIIKKEALFSRLKAVIWVPREDLDKYIEKSDAILIGPGLMRYQMEEDGGQGLGFGGNLYDEAGTYTKSLTHYLLHKFSQKQWVIDGGSLQVMEARMIPKRAVLTPNGKEYEIVFSQQFTVDNLQLNARRYECIIAYKGAVGYVTDGETTYEINGGNAGLTKGGTGDVLAGVISGLATKNPPILAAAAGMWLVKKTAESLYEEVGFGYNADNLADEVFKTWKREV